MAGDVGPPRDALDTPDSPSIIYRDIPISAFVSRWTPQAIQSALANHAVGHFGAAAMLIETLFGDDRVQATLGSRTGALFGQKVQHTPGTGDAAAECADAWQAQWQKLTGQGVLFEIKRWAIMNGFMVAEILYDTSVTPWRQYLKPWSPMFIRYDSMRRCLMAQTRDGEVEIVPGNGKWFVHAPFGLYRGWIHASVRAIADKWLIKQLAWRDWARFNERHGLPIIKAYVPAAGDARQKANFVASMRTMGQEAVVGLPQNVDETGYDLELLEARDRAWETFQGTVEAVDRSIILTIKSQNLTTEVEEGSLAAARQHGNVEQVTLQFDNATFAQDLYEQVARPFALFNFGDADAATRSDWDTTPREDYVAKVQTLSAFASSLVALRNAGIAVDAVAMASDYGIELKGASPVDPLTLEVANASKKAAPVLS